MTRLFMWVGILATSLTSPLQAQVSSDTVAISRETAIIFRFMPGKLMSYASFSENEQAIKKLGELMDEHKDELVQENAFVGIQGFCSSFPTEKENIQAVRNRTNQVKSYFIASTDRQVKPDTVRWACAEEEIRERTYPDSITGARKETVVYETTECDSFAQEQAV